MSRVLAEALERRGRKWGERNDEVRRLLHADKLPVRRFPSRPRQMLGDGAFVTRIGVR